MKRTFSNCNPYHDNLGRFTNKDNAHTIAPCCGSGPETPSSQRRQQVRRQADQLEYSKPEYVVIYPTNNTKRNVQSYTLSSGRQKSQKPEPKPNQELQSDSSTQRAEVILVQRVPRNIQAAVVQGGTRAPQKPDLEQQKEATPQPAPEPRAQALKEVIKVEATKKKYTHGDWIMDELKDIGKWVVGFDPEKVAENNKRLEELRNEPGGWDANSLEVLKLQLSSGNEAYGSAKRLDQLKEYIAPSNQPKGSFLGKSVSAPNQPAKSLIDAFPSLKGRAGWLAKAGIAGAGMLVGEKFSKESETPKKYNTANLAYDFAKYLTCDWDVLIDNYKRLEEVWNEPGGLSANEAEVGRIITTTAREFFHLVPLGKIIKTSTKGVKGLKALINSYKNKQLSGRTAANPSASTGTPRVKPTKSSPVKDISTGEAPTTTTTKKIKNDLFKEKRIETTQGTNRVDSQKTTSLKPKTNAKNLDSRKAKAPKEEPPRYRYQFAVPREPK